MERSPERGAILLQRHIFQRNFNYCNKIIYRFSSTAMTEKIAIELMKTQYNVVIY